MVEIWISLIKNIIEIIIDKLDAERVATEGDISRFKQLGIEGDNFAPVINALTERPHKLVSSYKIAEEIHSVAKDLTDDDEARQVFEELDQGFEFEEAIELKAKEF